MQDRLRRKVVFSACACLIAGTWSSRALAQTGQARITADVPPGVHKTLRLRNVPKDAQLAIAVQASSRILLSLIGEEDAKRYPDVTEPLFTAPVERAMSFSVTLPSAGNYYVVFDNRKGEAVSKVRLIVRAARSRADPVPPAPPAAEPPVSPPPPADRPSPLRRRTETHEM
ncbi:MAG: hypothetical protein IPK20_22760 [Betaproteobacteria bacterium]|nr:hypothetical protein [Betaproteobacteria bacterium]